MGQRQQNYKIVSSQSDENDSVGNGGFDDSTKPTYLRNNNVPKLDLNSIDTIKMLERNSLTTRLSSSVSNSNLIEDCFLNLKQKALLQNSIPEKFKLRIISKVITVKLVPQIVLPENSLKQTYVDFKLVGSKNLMDSFGISKEDFCFNISLVDYENPYAIDLKFELYPENEKVVETYIKETSSLPNICLKSNKKSGSELNQNIVFLNDKFLSSSSSSSSPNSTNYKETYYDTENLIYNFSNFKKTAFFNYHEHYMLYLQELDKEIKKFQSSILTNPLATNEKDFKGGEVSGGEGGKIMTTFRETTSSNEINIKTLDFQDFYQYFLNYILVSKNDYIYEIIQTVIIPRSSKVYTSFEKKLEEYTKKIKNDNNVILVKKEILREALEYVENEFLLFKNKNFIPETMIYLNEPKSHQFLKNNILEKTIKYKVPLTNKNKNQKPETYSPKKLMIHNSIQNEILCTFYVEYIKPYKHKNSSNVIENGHNDKKLQLPTYSIKTNKINSEKTNFDDLFNEVPLTSREPFNDKQPSNNINEEINSDDEENDYDSEDEKLSLE